MQINYTKGALQGKGRDLGNRALKAKGLHHDNNYINSDDDASKQYVQDIHSGV